MLRLSRREFLAGAAVTSAAALAGLRTFAAPAESKAVKGTDLVTLGKSKIQTTVLGMGTGTVGGSEQRALGQEAFTRLLRHAYDRGIRYIDTADMYMTHLFVRFALKGLPREEFFIQTKTRATHPEVAKADIERYRRELNTPYLDSLLMHAMGKGTWPTDMRPVMDVLDEAKRKGHVRAVGISSHGLDPLRASIDCDWIDIQLARINPFGVQMDGPPEEVAPLLKQAHQRGHGVLGMKIYCETGLESREKRLQSLKYVLGLGCVDAFPIGFTKPEQIDETLDLIEEATA